MPAVHVHEDDQHNSGSVLTEHRLKRGETKISSEQGPRKEAEIKVQLGSSKSSKVYSFLEFESIPVRLQGYRARVWHGVSVFSIAAAGVDGCMSWEIVDLARVIENCEGELGSYG